MKIIKKSKLYLFILLINSLLFSAEKPSLYVESRYYYRYESGLNFNSEYKGDHFFEPSNFLLSMGKYLNLSGGISIEKSNGFNGFYIFENIKILRMLSAGTGFVYKKYITSFTTASDNYFYLTSEFNMFGIRAINGLAFLSFTIDPVMYKIPFLFSKKYSFFQILFLYHISYTFIFLKGMFTIEIGVNNFDNYRVDNINNPAVFLKESLKLYNKFILTGMIDTKIAGLYGLAGKFNSIRIIFKLSYKLLTNGSFLSKDLGNKK